MTLQKFNTGTLEAPATFALGLADHPDATADGIVRRLKVFKSGTFADSRGRVNTWTQADLEAMSRHFIQLRDNGVLPNVPVRMDHTTAIRDVVGWYHAVYTDPNEPGFLFADVEFTEPEAKAKYDRRTFRNRSIEVGQYVTNTGDKYSPVVLGLAFVDLPAVEGLFRSPHAPTSGHSAPGDSSSGAGSSQNAQGGTMSGNQNDQTGGQGDGTGDGGATPPPARETPPPTPPAQPTPDTPGDGNNGGGTSNHQRPQVHVFRVNGAEVHDYAAVQAHIVALETFRNETVEAGRTGFVDQLAAANKITNPMKESFRALVLTMTDAQFASFKAGWDSAPAAAIFGQVPSTNGQPPAAGATPSERETLEEVVAQHRRSGMDEEAVRKTKSYRRLQELTQS